MTAVPQRALFRIRIAMIAGVLALAVIVFVQRRSGAFASDLSQEQLSAYRVMTWAAAGIAGVVVLALRLFMPSRPPEQRPKLTIIAWAVGEFAALSGIVSYMLSGAESSAAAGLIAFVTAMVLFPSSISD